MPRKRSRMGYRGLSPRERWPAPEVSWGTGPVCPECASTETVVAERYGHGVMLELSGWCGNCDHRWKLDKNNV